MGTEETTTEVKDVQSAPRTVTERLRTLHEEYVTLVNEAVAANRLDLADELAAQHDAAALRIIEAADGPVALPRTGATGLVPTRATRVTLAARLRSAVRGRQAA